VQGRDHRSDHPLRNSRNRSRVRGVLFQSRTAKSQKPLSPQLHRTLGLNAETGAQLCSRLDKILNVARRLRFRSCPYLPASPGKGGVSVPPGLGG
jgi:hypothetical protein